MGREAPDGGSSSPNVKNSVADLQKRGAGKETLRVLLSEGSSFFIPSGWDSRFPRGHRLSDEELQEIRRADQLIRCREWAARFLAGKEESSGRLLRKMAAREYDRDTALAVLEEMQSLGFQDDRRFAEQWLLSRMKKHPESRGCLEAGLIQRGVPRDTARQAVNDQVGDEEEQEMLQRCMRKLIPSSNPPGEKDIRRLMRRGFSYQAIKKNFAHDNDN